MNFKYIGEAIALLGIAWSIMRWIGRNVSASDARSHAALEVDLRRHRDRGVGAPRASASTPEGTTTQDDVRIPEPASPPDPEMLDRAAAMFGISRDALIQMDPRERSLLLSGYRAARRASGGTSSK